MGRRIVYLPELLGLPKLPDELGDLLSPDDEVLVFSYDKEELDASSPELLTWENQARQALHWLNKIEGPVTLLGNSLGWMMALHLLEFGYNPQELWLYKLPSFGPLRRPWREKYEIWSEDPQALLAKIEAKDPHKADFLYKIVLENIAKLLKGAALSDVNPARFRVFRTSSYRVIEWDAKDLQHPIAGLLEFTNQVEVRQDEDIILSSLQVAHYCYA